MQFGQSYSQQSDSQKDALRRQLLAAGLQYMGGGQPTFQSQAPNTIGLLSQLVNQGQNQGYQGMQAPPQAGGMTGGGMGGQSMGAK